MLEINNQISIKKQAFLLVVEVSLPKRAHLIYQNYEVGVINCRPDIEKNKLGQIQQLTSFNIISPCFSTSTTTYSRNDNSIKKYIILTNSCIALFLGKDKITVTTITEYRDRHTMDSPLDMVS